ncbi:unnamed protein product [Closterium sp. Naga37s-1]|nr:unnamed protein product [Closterium sp. Naga37s-1]
MMIRPRSQRSGNVEMASHCRANSTVGLSSQSAAAAVAASIPSRSALASRRPLRAPPTLALGALHSLALNFFALLCLALLAVSPLASARSFDNAPPAAVPPPPPPSPPSGSCDATTHACGSCSPTSAATQWGPRLHVPVEARFQSPLFTSLYLSIPFSSVIRFPPPAAVPPPPPPSPPSGGYDYTCLWKDVSKTNCSDKSVGPWGILTFIVLLVAAGLIICTPFFILYRQTQRGSQKLRICCCGRKYPEYAEVEARAAANSTDMPRPPEVSKFRSMSTSSSTDKT